MTLEANQSFMSWICSPILLGLGFMSDILWAISLVIFMRATKDTKALMSCTLKAMIVLGYPQNNTRFKPGSTRVKPPKKILPVIDSSSIEWDLVLTGSGKYAPLILIITDGLSGFLFSSTKAGMTQVRTKPGR